MLGPQHQGASPMRCFPALCAYQDREGMRGCRHTDRASAAGELQVRVIHWVLLQPIPPGTSQKAISPLLSPAV